MLSIEDKDNTQKSMDEIKEELLKKRIIEKGSRRKKAFQWGLATYLLGFGINAYHAITKGIEFGVVEHIGAFAVLAGIYGVATEAPKIAGMVSKKQVVTSHEFIEQQGLNSNQPGLIKNPSFSSE